jgi:hypothetical protein
MLHSDYGFLSPLTIDFERCYDEIFFGSTAARSVEVARHSAENVPIIKMQYFRCVTVLDAESDDDLNSVAD